MGKIPLMDQTLRAFNSVVTGQEALAVYADILSKSVDSVFVRLDAEAQKQMDTKWNAWGIEDTSQIPEECVPFLRAVLFPEEPDVGMVKFIYQTLVIRYPSDGYAVCNDTNFAEEGIGLIHDNPEINALFPRWSEFNNIVYKYIEWSASKTMSISPEGMYARWDWYLEAMTLIWSQQLSEAITAALQTGDLSFRIEEGNSLSAPAHPHAGSSGRPAPRPAACRTAGPVERTLGGP